MTTTRAKYYPPEQGNTLRAEHVKQQAAKQRNRSAFLGLFVGLPLALGLFWLPMLWLVAIGHGWLYLPYVGVVVGGPALWVRATRKH